MNLPDATSSMKAHYERQLAPVYTWMIGDVNAALERGRQFLVEAGVGAGRGRQAVDLGCGFGMHSIPLADLGFQVLAVDLSAELLRELERRRGDRAIHAVEADLRGFGARLESSAQVIVCMGDTLTHLPDWESVDQVLTDAARSLGPGGALILGFRDYVSAPAQGVQRFIPVRSDSDRILTCFLETCGDHVLVTDLIHERAGEGWTLRAGAYQKLRIDPDRVVRRLATLGLEVVRRTVERGMVTVMARQSGG